MPKNVKRKKNNRSRYTTELRVRKPEDGEFYADIDKPVGSARYVVDIVNGDEQVVVTLKGSMQKGPGFEHFS